MKPNEVRNFDNDEILNEVNKRREELRELRFQAAVGQLSNPRRIRMARREIARLLTIGSERVGVQE
ncbi:MAG: 50S ribosomal protein L29 [Trueperaceae bacterium]|jgi:large subunit ribosomal protein L29|nr:50S ribosomal protein L29 [Trueperaceae bacterium]|tara:strand:- start:99 stop:296 length:198 start_codon:yes stop_codon:yes gene_type:complete